MRTKKTATELKDRLNHNDRGDVYEVLKDGGHIPRSIGSWYVKRVKRGKVKS